MLLNLVIKQFTLKLIMYAKLIIIVNACTNQDVKYQSELDKLMNGNQRFASLRPTHPNEGQKTYVRRI